MVGIDNFCIITATEIVPSLAALLETANNHPVLGQVFGTDAHVWEWLRSTPVSRRHLGSCQEQ